METIAYNRKEIDQIIDEIVSKYGHDAFFHYLVKNHDGIRLTLCQKMIPDKKIVSTVVENSELYGDYVDGKKYVLDILAKDEYGNYYNIEMQCYSIDKNEMIRFQLYGYRVVDHEAKKGDNYYNVKPIRQMIINTKEPLENLTEYMHHFEYYDIENKVKMPYSLSEIFLVQLAYLDMEKEYIDVFDELMYLFKNDEAYDKIKPDRMIQEAINMHEEYMSSDERLAAIIRERDEMTLRSRVNLRIKEATEKGLQQGMEQGLQQGIEQGLQQGIEQGIQQGITITKSKILVSQLIKKLGSLSEETQELIYNSTLEKIDIALDNIFEIESEREVINILK